MKNLEIAIYHGADKESRVADFFADLEFDRFTIIECKKILSGKTEIVVSNRQKEHIRDVIIHYLDQGVLKSEVVYKDGRVRVTSFVRSIVFLAQYFDLSLDEDKLLDMTLVPDICFEESKVGRKYEYLKEHILMNKLKGRIAQNLNVNDLDDVLLRDHIVFCSDILCDVATNKCLTICNTELVDSWVRSAALDYLYKLYGADYICNRILPNATGEFLLEIAAKCKDIPSHSLRSALENEYCKAPSYELMAYLIPLDSKIGIEAYVEEVTKTLRVPEKNVHPDTPTGVIRMIDNPVFLPLIGRLIDAVCNPHFVDDDFFGLRSSLSDALINCGRRDFVATIALIKEHRIDTDGSIRFCNYVIENIKRNQQKSSDRPKSLQEVKLILKNI